MLKMEGSVLMRKYDVGRMLGKGTFGKVYFGKDLKTGGSVAIKVIDKEKVLKVGLIDQTKREISVMGLVKHENVMQLHEVLATKTKIYFVMEYAKGGELFNKISKGKLKEEVARKYFQQLIRAVSFCHSRGVYHRDLKPENLLLDEEGNLKVSDFGLSAMKETRRKDGLLHTTCGTPAYVAPEVVCRKGYDGAKADIWSCGVILFVLLAGHLPFQDSNLIEMYKKIAKAEFKFPSWFSPDVRRLLTKILDPNPTTRVSMARIMQSAWFKKGLDSKNSGTNEGLTENSLMDVDSGSFADMKLAKPTNLNAFDIISLSAGFDLSGFFVRNDQKDEVQFTSTKSATDIVSKIEDIASHLKMDVVRKGDGSMKLKGLSGSKKNRIISIDVVISEITSSFHLVDLKKSSGDTVDYQKMLRRSLRPALGEIVWAWQGEQKAALVN